MTDEAARIPDFMEQMAEILTKSVLTLNHQQIEVFFNEILSAKRIYVAGAGRSGLIARAFGLRLMHLGLSTYVVGETITPAFISGDTLVMFSGSGETHSMVSICGTAHDLGGKVCLVTASPDSRMGRMADSVVNLGDLTGYYSQDKNSFEIRQLTGNYRSVTSAFAPLGTLFETLALVFSDAVISALMEAKKAKVNDMKDRITNVE
jgi:6-phospho-3-hexuloisomerase